MKLTGKQFATPSKDLGRLAYSFAKLGDAEIGVYSSTWKNYYDSRSVVISKDIEYLAIPDCKPSLIQFRQQESIVKFL